VYLARRKSAGGLSYSKEVFAVKVTKKFRKNIELEVFQQTVGQFSEQSGPTAAVDDSSTPFDFFSIFFPESMIKHIKTETNRYAKSIADKLRRTKKLKPHSIWHTWTGVRLHEMYLFFAVIIHMCLAKKPKTQRLLVNK